MDTIVKEELYRCAGTFFLAVIISIGFLKEVLGSSIFTVLIIPFIITVSVFLIFVIIRKKYFNGIMIVTLLVGFLMINVGLILFYLYGFKINNIFLVIIGGIMFIYGLTKLSKSKISKSKS